MTIPSEDALTEAFARECATIRQRLTPELQETFDAVLIRRGAHPSVPRRPLFHPLGQPVMDLVRWVSDWLTAEGSPPQERAMIDAALAAEVGYFHVRVLDDLVDEGLGDPTNAPLLASALLARHQRLLARVAGEDPLFWDVYEDAWLAWVNGVRVERRVCQRVAVYSDADFEVVLDQSRPLIVAPAALLAAADSLEKVPALLRLVRSITRSGQLFHDLGDAIVDERAGRYSWVVRRAGGIGGSLDLRRGLVAGGGIDAIAGLSLAAVADAARCAQEWPLPATLEWLERRAEAIQQTVTTIWEKLFAGMLTHSN